MKELILLRHAKSSWDDPALDDFDRPLAPRGRRAAPLMGRHIAACGWVPDRVLVSPALRARHTWRLAAAEMTDAKPAVAMDAALYMASAERLLGVIRAVPGHTRRLVLVGHNPGLETLALGLGAPESDADSLDRMRRKFPTAALARFVLGDSWAELGLGAARLTHFLRPKDLS